MTSTLWNGNSIEVGVFSKSALRGRGGMDIFWNYKIWAWGSINCSIWTQSCIIIVEKVTEKQSWHSLQDQGSAAISLAKPLHWRRVGCNVDRILCIGCYLIFIFIYIIYIPISIISVYISTTSVYFSDPTLFFPDCDDTGWLPR